MDFCLASYHYTAAVIKMTRIYAGSSGVQTLAEMFPPFTTMQLFCSPTEIDTINDGAQCKIFIKYI